MTSAEIRQSFLDFFREKKHTVVPSSSLLPDAPNLLFTNAGMNQFVPIFLGQQRPSFDPPRAADTQKCIRAGGKHNDLDDVGLDTYHHTFFEMLGNWSFGDYFKQEAIEWAWELVVRRWKFPPERLYATVYRPGLSEPADFDQEAHDHWHRLFTATGLDAAVHVVNGNKKDNFWMMGDTGPCGPCSELHVDLTPLGDTRGALVNAGDPRCIEIWNLVFIQFNANPDGTFSPLPARHVDTGMGFERVTAIIQGTKNFSDFTGTISNYETDIFRPIFDAIEKFSGKTYTSTLPKSGAAAESEQEKIDVAFRVVADHIRTLSFAIADGIQPSNEGRGYVLRRILRRAVRYGRSLGRHEPFFYRLVEVLALTMGDVFPELTENQAHIEATLKREEESFNRTLDKGIALFEAEVARLQPPGSARDSRAVSGDPPETSPASETRYAKRRLPHFERPWGKYAITFSTEGRRPLTAAERDIVLDSILFPAKRNHFELYVACVMPDHVHLLLEPQVESQDGNGNAVFFPLTELLQNIKSVSAHRINKARGAVGPVWEKESFDRLIRSEADLQEKYLYICKNPWESRIAQPNEDYRWLWTPESARAPGESPDAARESRALPGAHNATQISGAFAFRLYDEQGFPLDLTELMARERGLTVDTEGFEKLMEEQRARGRSAQKKEVIAVSQGIPPWTTTFVGYNDLRSEGGHYMLRGDQLFVEITPFYAEMGGQVGDTGHVQTLRGSTVEITNTLRAPTGHYILRVGDPSAFEEPDDVPFRYIVNAPRRAAIERHHTVTHLLHWALHEVVSRDATQKGSYVGPEKLTFDFSSAALTEPQVREVEKLVNEKIAENAPVSWTEIPYPEAKRRANIMQFFGDKYGDMVRVVQIGGVPNELNGYSMELCGGTHVRATGDIGSFRILSEGAIAAGIRRIEAVAGHAVGEWAQAEAARQEEIWARGLARV
ncbi:MAG TPA: alanine--tRNA ligase [Chthoniobacterales bacterium]|nr:alanine--tRNA ligase [Chthoniobacterales bacterium]